MFDYLLKKGFSDITFFAKGKRGVIYTAVYKNKKVAIKVKRPSSRAENRIKNEAYWLDILNKNGVGPKVVYADDHTVAYVFVEGVFIIDFLKEAKKEDILVVLKKIFKQLYTMDALHVNKLEMHRPMKHIIISNKKVPVLLDFERCYLTEKPKNVTQFCQFLVRNEIRLILTKKRMVFEKKQLLQEAKNYKQAINEKRLKNILQVLS